MKNILNTALIIIFSFVIIQCGGSKSGKQYPRFASGDNEIISFTFPASKNTLLSGDVTGTISDNAINLTVPYNTDLNGLIAEYITNSNDVEVNGSVQKSGITANNFSSQVVYTVTADNGDTREYNVTVMKAPSTEKSITAFSINGCEGAIDQEGERVSDFLCKQPLITSAPYRQNVWRTGLKLHPNSLSA